MNHLHKPKKRKFRKTVTVVNFCLIRVNYLSVLENFITAKDNSK